MKNKAKLEGCMASKYMYDEALRFTTEYLALYPHTRRRIWDANKKEANVSEMLSGNGASKMLSSMEMDMIHEHVITNFVAIEVLYKYLDLYHCTSFCQTCQ